MHTHVIYNGELLKSSEAHLPAISEAVLYGRGVFTTLAVYGGQPFLWAEHWARLTDHAGRVGIDRSNLDEATVRGAINKLIEANRVHNGRARITLLDQAGKGRSGIWAIEPSSTGNLNFLIMTGDAHSASEAGLALTISPYRINTHSPLVGIKSVNYLDHVLSLEEARGREFEEGILLNERGEIVSAAMANIFWASGGILHTSALATGALAGTTRACVIRLADQLSIPVVEGVYELPHLAEADEIFLTSAGRGVELVTAFDFRRYTIPVGSLALRLREAFRQLTLHAD